MLALWMCMGAATDSAMKVMLVSAQTKALMAGCSGRQFKRGKSDYKQA